MSDRERKAWEDMTEEEQAQARLEQRGLYQSDEFQERTMPGQADYIPVNSPREELVQELIRSGDLDMRQAQDILNLTNDTMPIERVAGYVAGEFNIAPKAIEESLSGTGVEVKASTIEETKRSFLRSVGDVGGRASDFMESWMMRPFKMAGSGIRNVAGINTPFVSTDDGIEVREGEILKGDAWYRDTEEETADKKQREEVRDDTRELIRGLAGDGYITNERATKMLSVTDNYDEGTAQDLHDELTGILEAFDYTSADEAIYHSTVLKGLENRGAIRDGDAGPEEDVEDVEDVGADIEAQAAVETQGWGEFDSFRSLTEAMGMATQERPAIPDTEKQTTTGLMIDFGEGQLIDYNFPDPIGPGKDAIMDRATGAVLTNEMYNLIRTDAALRKRYQELGKPTEAINELLESGKFNVPGRTQLGKNYIPVEDIGVPSVAPSRPWETQAYNWSQGSGAAQWGSMASYSRRAKVKYMIDSGVATPEQAADYSNPFSLSGAQQWGRVLGVSRELQVAPYEAMNSMGAEISRIRSLVNRKGPSGGYRGGGGGGPTYSVPASLREIPDYKTLAQRTKSIFNEELGRDMEDWELSALADELKDKYTTANEERIQIHKAAWNDAVAGGSTEVDFTAVEEPLEAHQFDIGEKYESEINRNERVEDRANNRNLLMNSISIGERMV